MKVPSFDLTLPEIRESLAKLRRPLRIAILRAQNGFNVGAIIRVAHSFLVKDIVLVGDEPFYRRAAMGMDRYENIVYLPNENALLEWAAGHEVPLVAFEREHATAELWSAALPEACVMVFGSERGGVPPQIIEAAASVVAIPMYGINNSYPVAVAAGIAMAEWTRRFYGSKGTPARCTERPRG
jgi:tRNA G18 (ribose-2'-O)-methylase SpoU